MHRRESVRRTPRTLRAPRQPLTLPPWSPRWTVSTRRKPGWPSGRGLWRTPMETGVGRVLRKVSRPVRYCRVLRRL